MSNAEARGEILRVYAAVTLVTVAVTYMTGPVVQEFGQLGLAAAFLFGALWLARKRPGGPERYGIDLSGVLEPRRREDGTLEPFAETGTRALRELARELGFACLVAIVVFPPFVLAYQVLHRVEHPFTLHLPAQPLEFVLSQLVVVALPEEALFRGYFQTRLGDLHPRRVRFLGAEFSPVALVVQAALFGVLHFAVGLSPARLAVFFPGLLFGYLRARRGGIGASTWFHAFSNVLAELLARGYL